MEAYAKFRFFDQDLGKIDGIVRLLDLGKSNDSFSAISVAQALSQAFNMDINDLHLSLVLSWYE
jgi:hydroxylamine reductase